MTRTAQALDVLTDPRIRRDLKSYRQAVAKAVDILTEKENPMTTTTHDTVSGAADDLARQIAEVGHGHVLLAPGNATLYEVAVLRVEGGWVVAVPNLRGAYRFGYLLDLHVSYVAEKLDILPGDADVLVDLLDATGTEVARLVVG